MGIGSRIRRLLSRARPLPRALCLMRMALVSVEHSRMLKLAGIVSGRSGSAFERRLDTSILAVSVESDLPEAELTARTLLTTLRRGPGRIMLVAGGLDRGFLTDVES